MNKNIIFLIVLICSLQSCAFDCINVYSGQVKDSKTNLPISNARVILLVDDEVWTLNERGKNMLTDSAGFFNIYIITGFCLDNVSLLFVKDGYLPKIKEVIKEKYKHVPTNISLDKLEQCDSIIK